MQQVSSSSNKQFVLAFPAVWAFVCAVETVELELSQERFESGLVEGSLEDCNKRFFICFVPIAVNLERLSIGHPGNDMSISVPLGIFKHVVEALGKHRGSLLVRIASTVWHGGSGSSADSSSEWHFYCEFVSLLLFEFFDF